MVPINKFYVSVLFLATFIHEIIVAAAPLNAFKVQIFKGLVSC
jgi:hypothetical protein